MIEYTVILLYDWNNHGNDIKKMFQDNNLLLNSTFELTNEELKNEYIKFMVEDDIKIDKSITGLSGYYELDDKSIVIKIIKNTLNSNMILVYKGIKNEFFTELITKCRDMSALVIGIEDDELAFRKRLNVELIKYLNDIEGENEIKVKIFVEKMSLFSGIFSDDFKNQWTECIRKDII